MSHVDSDGQYPDESHKTGMESDKREFGEWLTHKPCLVASATSLTTTLGVPRSRLYAQRVSVQVLNIFRNYYESPRAGRWKRPRAQLGWRTSTDSRGSSRPICGSRGRIAPTSTDVQWASKRQGTATRQPERGDPPWTLLHPQSLREEGWYSTQKRRHRFHKHQRPQR